MIAACGQMVANTIEEAERVWPVVERLAGQAAAAHADLFVLPETTYPAYWLHSVERYMRPDVLRSAEVLKRFAALAGRHRLWLVAGFVEERGGKLCNSAAVFNRRGDLTGIARKNFLWDCDNRWFTPGESIAAMDTEFGRVGVLICADCRAPEIAATLVADGARMLILPTAWVNVAKPDAPPRNIHPEFLIRARAMEFGAPFVCCSKTGLEGRHLGYVGQSRIIAGDGRTLAEAPAGGEHLIVADVSQGNPKLSEWDDSIRERLQARVPPYRAVEPGAKIAVQVQRDAGSIAAELTAAGARVATLSVRHLSSFAPARYHGLNGVQVLVVNGRVDDDAFLRARAAENRVFVIAAEIHVAFIVHPDGSILYSGSEDKVGALSYPGGKAVALRPHMVEIDLALADLKQFTPETDIWHQRRVECYRLPGDRRDAQARATVPHAACGS
jgi:predicted amidohydrolase